MQGDDKMAKGFSIPFYRTQNWKKTREYIFKRDSGLCQDCLSKGKITPGKEVHHIIFLNADNIDNPNIALGEDNLILLCKECHHRRHSKKDNTRDGLMFNEFGELIEG